MFSSFIVYMVVGSNLVRNHELSGIELDQNWNYYTTVLLHKPNFAFIVITQKHMLLLVYHTQKSN